MKERKTRKLLIINSLKLSQKRNVCSHIFATGSHYLMDNTLTKWSSKKYEIVFVDCFMMILEVKTTWWVGL